VVGLSQREDVCCEQHIVAPGTTVNKEAGIAYVSKYASQAESTSSSYQDTWQKAINQLQDSEVVGVAYQKMFSSFAAEHISSQETCHLLHKLSLVKSSHKYQNIYVAHDERYLALLQRGYDQCC
jgi:hypothetical protein